MYQGTAELRPELLAVVQEARAIDNKFIAERIFTPYPVKTRTGYYMRIKRGGGGLLSTEGSDALKRAPGTPYKSTGRTFSTDSWNLYDRGLKEPLDDVNTQDQGRFFDVESASALWLERNIRISREARVAAKVQNSSVWGIIDSTGDLNYIDANAGTVDFAKDVKNAKRMVDKRQEDANTLVLSRELWDFVTLTDKLRFFLFGQLQGNSMITPEMVAAKFELSQVLIGSASFSTLKKGKEKVDDSDLQWCWANSSFWIGNVQEGAPEIGGAGREFILEDTTGGALQVVETYRDEDLRSNIIRVREDSDEQVVNENSGLLVKTAGY